MEDKIQAFMHELLHGKKYVRLSLDQLRAFNNHLAVAGFSISRMEATKTAGARTGRRLDYDILVLPEHDEGWAIFANPDRSRAHVSDLVDQAVREGGTFEFLVWAEKPSD
jgi:hypothetical protein